LPQIVTILPGQTEADDMPKRPSSSIAKKAYAKADADFATWLMMAKLGSFDDLPADAQGFLMSYRTRLDKMPEAEATSATVRDEVYVAYYAEMGGEGEAPDPAPIAARAEDNVVNLKSARLAQASRATSRATTQRSTRSWHPFLIFAGMVAVLAALKFAFGL
jgi:hypothetical protein